MMRSMFFIGTLQLLLKISLVSLQIWRRFTEFNMKRQSLKYDLPEYEIIDVTEEVCESDKTWER